MKNGKETIITSKQDNVVIYHLLQCPNCFAEFPTNLAIEDKCPNCEYRVKIVKDNILDSFTENEFFEIMDYQEMKKGNIVIH